MKKPAPSVELTPLYESVAEPNLGANLADAALLLLRDSQERKEMLKNTSLPHEAIEDQLAAGEARRVVVVAAVAYIFEQLPKIVHKAVDDAVKGNTAASKLILEIAGLKDAAQESTDPGNESQEGIGPLDLGILESMREQIAAMPDLPQPPARK